MADLPIKMVMKGLYFFLAGVSFLASLVTINQAVKSETIYNFFSYTWWLAIIFPILFLLLGVVLLAFSGNKNLTSKSLYFSGVFYLIINIIWLFVFSYRQLTAQLLYLDYIGYYIILSVSTMVTIICFLFVSKRHLQLVSLAFLTGTIGFTIGWCYKYIFMIAKFKQNLFLRELSIFAFCAILFVFCQWLSKDKKLGKIS